MPQTIQLSRSGRKWDMQTRDDEWLAIHHAARFVRQQTFTCMCRQLALACVAPRRKNGGGFENFVVVHPSSAYLRFFAPFAPATPLC